MKLSNLVWSLFGVMALSACSDNDVAEVIDQQTPGNEQGMEGDRFLSVQISNPITRAAGDEQDGYVEGTEDENQINSLRFYFFNTEGAPVSVSSLTEKNYVDATVTSNNGPDMPNVEKKYNAVVVLNTTQNHNVNVNKMVAIANYDNIVGALDQEMLSLTELQDKISASCGITSYTFDGTQKQSFLMTSSSYADENGQINAADIKEENLCRTQADAKANPVQVYIERVVAKAEVKLSDSYFNNGVEVTLNGNTCMAYPLKDTSDEQIQAMGKKVYVVFTGWNITGQANQSYLFKKINSTSADKWGNNTESGMKWIWNNPTFYRSYWAMNPINEDYKLLYDKYSTINKVIGGTDGVYMMENAADNLEKGTKANYDPETATTNRTQAIIAATLVTVNEGTATPVTVAKWGGGNYEVENLKTMMVTNKLYEKDGGNFIPVKPEHLTFVPAEAVNKANTNTEDSERYASYLQIAKDAEGITYYSSASDEAALTSVSAANDILKDIPGARIWKDGKTYYYTDLRHLNNAAVAEDATTTNGQYGVVRNHVYRVNITKLQGLGTPVNVPGTAGEPDFNIIPQRPEDNETYIAAQINVLSWRIVANNTELIW